MAKYFKKSVKKTLLPINKNPASNRIGKALKFKTNKKNNTIPKHLYQTGGDPIQEMKKKYENIKKLRAENITLKTERFEKEGLIANINGAMLRVKQFEEPYKQKKEDFVKMKEVFNNVIAQMRIRIGTLKTIYGDKSKEKTYLTLFDEFEQTKRPLNQEKNAIGIQIMSKLEYQEYKIQLTENMNIAEMTIELGKVQKKIDEFEIELTKFIATKQKYEAGIKKNNDRIREIDIEIEKNEKTIAAETSAIERLKDENQKKITDLTALRNYQKTRALNTSEAASLLYLTNYEKDLLQLTANNLENKQRAEQFNPTGLNVRGVREKRTESKFFSRDKSKKYRKVQADYLRFKDEYTKTLETLKEGLDNESKTIDSEYKLLYIHLNLDTDVADIQSLNSAGQSVLIGKLETGIENIRIFIAMLKKFTTKIEFSIDEESEKILKTIAEFDRPPLKLIIEEIRGILTTYTQLKATLDEKTATYQRLIARVRGIKKEPAGLAAASAAAAASVQPTLASTQSADVQIKQIRFGITEVESLNDSARLFMQIAELLNPKKLPKINDLQRTTVLELVDALEGKELEIISRLKGDKISFINQIITRYKRLYGDNINERDHPVYARALELLATLSSSTSSSSTSSPGGSGYSVLGQRLGDNSQYENVFLHGSSPVRIVLNQENNTSPVNRNATTSTSLDRAQIILKEALDVKNVAETSLLRFINETTFKNNINDNELFKETVKAKISLISGTQTKQAYLDNVDKFQTEDIWQQITEETNDDNYIVLTIKIKDYFSKVGEYFEKLSYINELKKRQAAEADRKSNLLRQKQEQQLKKDRLESKVRISADSNSTTKLDMLALRDDVSTTFKETDTVKQELLDLIQEKILDITKSLLQKNRELNTQTLKNISNSTLDMNNTFNKEGFTALLLGQKREIDRLEDDEWDTIDNIKNSIKANVMRFLEANKSPLLSNQKQLDQFLYEKVFKILNPIIERKNTIIAEKRNKQERSRGLVSQQFNVAEEHSRSFLERQALEKEKKKEKIIF